MTARAIGEITAGFAGSKPTANSKKVWLGNTRRTFQPVRRYSYGVGSEQEKRMWKPIADGTAKQGRKFWGALMRAAEQYDEDKKQPGKINGPLGYVALRVLRELGRLIDYKTGSLYPSIDTLSTATKRSRAAICSALKRLKEHGFIDWVRRVVPVDDPVPFGPQVQQTSNAYGIDIRRMPKAAAGLIRRIMKWFTPEAERIAREKAEEAQKAQFMNLSQEEQLDSVKDPKLRSRLASMSDALNASNAGPANSLNPDTEENYQKE